MKKENPTTTRNHKEDAYIAEADDDDNDSVLQNVNITDTEETNEITEEVNTIIGETQQPLAASRSPFTGGQEGTAVECPMQENLASCDIFLCRVFRNMLALPFPDCYATRF